LVFLTYKITGTNLKKLEDKWSANDNTKTYFNIFPYMRRNFVSIQTYVVSDT